MEQLLESSQGGIPAIVLKYEVISGRGFMSSQQERNKQNLYLEIEVCPAETSAHTPEKIQIV